MFNKSNKKSRLLAFIMVFMLFLGQLATVLPMPLAEAADPGPTLVITGTGLNQDVFISTTAWNDMQERYYSSNNTYNFHKILKVRGYDLFNLIGADNLKSDQDYAVQFIASDGFKQTKTVSQLKALKYYSDFTDAKAQSVGPMIGYYYKELISDDTPEPPISWTDQTLTTADVDSKAPRAYFGQANTDDKNQSKFVGNLDRVVVGEERPDIFTVRGNGVTGEKSFSITDLKSVPAAHQINENYLYNSKGGAKTALVKGVDLSYLLNTMVGIKDPTAQVKFICSDNYPVNPVSQQDIANTALKYVLAYEVDGAAISDDSGKANVRIYRKQASEGEFNTVTKNIVGIEVIGESASIDFAISPYKHITYTGAPYNVDAITGATMTIEGPGVESYRALSLRQIESENAGLFRGTYAESINGAEKQNSYEGISVAYLLDNFVKLRSNAGKVVFKDKSRQTIAEYSLDDIRRADYRNNSSGAADLKMIVAYGVNELPLVYKNVDTGYVATKYNDNGCFKLVLGQSAAGDAAPTFSNVAYIYVKEADATGIYEHTQAPYNDPKYTNYIFTLTGKGLGQEANYSTADLEAMQDLAVEKEYSLSNSQYYWYYNKYKGIPLWQLLLKINPNVASLPDNTPVKFEAADYYNVTPMTIADIKNDSLYGYYEKDPLDLGDGTFTGSTVQPLYTGYPVLIAYGFNGYPYVVGASDSGYNTGLGNSGGPLRIIFGKTSYNHTNGSKQVQLVKRIIIGDELPYSTHSYGDYEVLGASPINITVKSDDGAVLKEQNLSVKDIEDMLYAESVPNATKDEAREKARYFTKISGAGAKVSDLYEGVGLNYLLFNKVGLTGTTGTVTFEDETGAGTLTVSLADIVKKDYFNEVSGATNLEGMLAFAKNGYPMVKAKTDKGYVSTAYNSDGPLLALFGQTSSGTPGQKLANVRKITIQIANDPCAHLKSPYSQYAANTLLIKGGGVRAEKSVTVGDLEAMQNYIINGNYCLASSVSDKAEGSYRGIDIYEYIRQVVGFTAGAASVTFKAADGTSQTLSMTEIAKQDYTNELNSTSNLRVMLAYGKNATPLVPNSQSNGYAANVNNTGGPLRLIIGQTAAGDLNAAKCMSGVTEINVEATAGDSWKHDHGVYTQYQDQAVLRVTGSDVKQPRTFSLKQLEALDAHIIRDVYNSEFTLEGVILWDLIKDVVGLKDGITQPSAVRVYSTASYNQITNLSQVINGVKNSKGVTKEIILGYAQNAYPLVPEASSNGYVNNNQFGPVRLIVEENGSMWIKWTDCIVVGTGNYEEPKAADIVADAPAVFTVSGAGISTPKAYTRSELSKNQEVTADYSYTNKGTKSTDSCTGVWLKDLLAASGISSPDAKITITTTDGYDNGTVTLQELMDQKYLVAYKVNGAVFEDTKTGYNSSSIRIYRNYDDGSTWRNRMTMVNGVNVMSAGSVLIDPVTRDWLIYRNDDQSGLPTASIRCVTPDTNGGIWVGTNGGGAAYRDANGDWTVYNTTNSSLPHNTVYAIAVDEAGRVWFAGGAPEAGMGIVCKKDKQWTVYNTTNSSLPSNFAQAIAMDNNGGTWLGTSTGPVYHDSAGNWINYTSDAFPASSVTVITPDNKGGVWFGFYPKQASSTAPYQGGYAYRNAAGQITAYTYTSAGPQDIAGTWVRSISIDKDGGVWIARFGKIDYIATDGTKTIYEKDSDFLPFLTGTNTIRVVAVDSTAGLWIGTTEGGLYYRNAAGKFCNYNDSNAWPTPTFKSVWSINACANGDLWVGTNGGVAGISSTVIKEWSAPTASLASGKKWTIKFNRPVSSTQSLSDYIYVTNSAGNKQDVRVVIAGTNQEIVEVQAPSSGYLPGNYTLWIKNSLLDSSGKELKQPVKMKFSITGS